MKKEEKNRTYLNTTKFCLALVLAFLLVSTASAELIVNEQPKEIYSFGDKITLPVTITSSKGVYDYLQLNLICDAKIKELSKSEISVNPNEVVKIEKSILLISKFIGNLSGACQIKGYLEDNPADYFLTNSFTISKSITVKIDNATQTNYNPEEKITVHGTATKQNGESVNGFVELNVITNNSKLNQTFQDVVNSGEYSISFTIPKDMKAGDYLLRVNIYEKDPLGEKSNAGFSDLNIRIAQIPTSLGILLDNASVVPGTSLRGKIILYDQTGEKISSTAIMTIKNKNNKILEQKEINIDEIFEFPIAYYEAPNEWSVVAISNKLTTESKFMISSKEDAKVEIINRTAMITNTGNIDYNKTLLVKIGENATEINVYLKVNETKKYLLGAPDGEYNVEIKEGDDGVVMATGSVLLTGDVVSVKELTGLGVIKKYPLAWIFIIVVLGFASYILFKKSYKKNFIGYITKRREKTPEKTHPKKSEAIFVEPDVKAEVSLSLKGEKLKASILCLNVKNTSRISNNESIQDLFTKINAIAKEFKAVVYENQNFLFLIFHPITTKTMRNEMPALKASLEFSNIIKEHNKLFKEKIDFGISVASVEMIANIQNRKMTFTSFGNSMTNAKKISSLTGSEIGIEPEVKEKLIEDIKVEKKVVNGVTFYTLKEIKDREAKGKYIGELLRRLERS
ncbi:hypothetical protein HY448_00600 [Candidatus Pacearchaeota archaeon]|nr:hypothetical protein [Candidatus Pacearchaeota archaeon]